jgi:hypothetical protein
MLAVSWSGLRNVSAGVRILSLCLTFSRLGDMKVAAWHEVRATYGGLRLVVLFEYQVLSFGVKTHWSDLYWLYLAMTMSKHRYLVESIAWTLLRPLQGENYYLVFTDWIRQRRRLRVVLFLNRCCWRTFLTPRMLSWVVADVVGYCFVSCPLPLDTWKHFLFLFYFHFWLCVSSMS